MEVVPPTELNLRSCDEATVMGEHRLLFGNQVFDVIQCLTQRVVPAFSGRCARVDGQLMQRTGLFVGFQEADVPSENNEVKRGPIFEQWRPFRL